MPPQIQIVLDTTVLNRLIAATKGGDIVRIVADAVEYGIYQELGTSRMGAQPFMVPAVEAVRPTFGKAFAGAITRPQAEAVVVKTAFDVERLAKQRSPVDTGALRNSIHVEKP